MIAVLTQCQRAVHGRSVTTAGVTSHRNRYVCVYNFRFGTTAITRTADDHVIVFTVKLPN